MRNMPPPHMQNVRPPHMRNMRAAEVALEVTAWALRRAVYLVQGVLDLSSLALSFFCKDDLHMDPAQVGQAE
jgi:hypothetical protein